MKIESEFRIVEIGRAPAREGRTSEVVLESIDGQQLKVIGLDADQARELGGLFSEPVKVTLEIRKRNV